MAFDSSKTSPAQLPVLCVHGIWDQGAAFAPLRSRLQAAGWQHTRAIDLEPNNGDADLPVLAGQVAAAVDALRAETGAQRIDLVGFSMGALVSRWYLQRLGGRQRVRRFVSISGPHAGTLTARLGRNPGSLSMRRGSPLLRDLAGDPDPWGEVEVHAFWTPFDLMIVPASSSRLPSARERRFGVPLHALMLRDARVLRAVVEVLGARGN